MWKTLIVVVSEQNKDRELDNFLARVKAQGIEVIEIEPALYVKRYKIGTVCQKESLLLTDTPIVAITAKKAGIALVGVRKQEAKLPVPAPYILQGLDGIQISYLKMVYSRFHHIPLIVAETERLVIQELTSSQTELFFGLCREAGLKTEAHSIKERDKIVQQQFLQAYIENQYNFYGYGIWGLIEKGNGKLVGIAGVEDREDCLELGYAIVPEKRRIGYAKEACQAIFCYLKTELELEGKIKSFVPKENIASQKTAQSIGMLQAKDIFKEFYCYERIL